jgi:hypothetical protein
MSFISLPQDLETQPAHVEGVEVARRLVIRVFRPTAEGSGES